MNKKKNIKNPRQSVTPLRLDKILRRRSVLLLIIPYVLALTTILLGVIYGRSLDRTLTTTLFWICAVLPVVLGVASVLLRNSYIGSFAQKSVAQMQEFILSHREQAEKTAAEKLRLLGKVRKLTGCYAAVFVLLAFGCGFCGGALVGTNTAVQLLITYWSGILYLCALTRLHLPTPAVVLEDDPFMALQEEYPKLFAIAKEASKSQGWDGKIAIRFASDCNAGVRMEGDICCLYVGVTLLNMLTEEELLSVFCHEFFHMLREEETDSTEIRHKEWLGRGGNAHYFRGLTDLPYAFPDAFYNLTFDLYRYADAIAEETAADQAMIALTDGKTAASALVKIKYHELYEWEFGTWDCPCAYLDEHPDTAYLQKLLTDVKARMQLQMPLWNDLIHREIQGRSATHPIVRTRLAGLGVTEIPEIHFQEAGEYLNECQKAMAFCGQKVCENLKKADGEERENNYLIPKQKVEQWEADGKPLVAETYAVIDQALRQLGRNQEAEALCQRALSEFTGAAACYAHYMHGCFLLRSYDEDGIDHIYQAIEGNTNYIESGMELLGHYCCLTGNQQELDHYRSRVIDVMQQHRDVYQELGFLRKTDRLQPENLPEELMQPLLEYIASIDDGNLEKVYLVRKVITEEFFTSAIVLKYRDGTDVKNREDLYDKMFQYLDTCSDWQFSLFDYDTVAKVKVETIPGSCVYSHE